jgi:hypothetical protein
MRIKADPTRIPQRGDTADVWKNWHETLKSNFGKKTANQLFIQNWKVRGTTSVSTNSLRDYLKDNGIEISTTAIQDIVDKGSDITDFFGDTFKVGKYIGISLAVIVVGGLAFAIYNAAKNPAASAGTALRAYKGGM